MKLSEKLWCDLENDSEKHSWLLMGMGVSTGVVCHAVQTDLANSYRVKMQVEKERDTYRDLCVDLLNTLRIAESWLEGWASAESELEKTRGAINKAESILGEIQ